MRNQIEKMRRERKPDTAMVEERLAAVRDKVKGRQNNPETESQPAQTKKKKHILNRLWKKTG